jgi:hypothetical protein
MRIKICYDCKWFVEESQETGRGRCTARDYGGAEKRWHGTISATNCPKAEPSQRYFEMIAKGAKDERSEF